MLVDEMTDEIVQLAKQATTQFLQSSQGFCAKSTMP